MAWRPTRYLIKGELDNTKPGKVTGWMMFAGISEKISFDLKGDFHRDIRGAKIRFCNDDYKEEGEIEAAEYMRSFAVCQEGKVGDMTAGFEPADYVKGYVYLEWYSDQNGRVVIELQQDKVEVIGEPLPADKCEPICKREQQRNMEEFMTTLAQQLNIKQ